MQQKKLRLLILAALISALCVIGSFIKIPVGTITTAALDSTPAFLSAAFLPPMYGAAVGAIGHIATAYSSGFPFGPLHMMVAVEMAVIIGIFAWMHKKGLHKSKWLFAFIANGMLSALPFAFIISWQFYLGAMPGLVIATAINLVITALLMPVVAKIAMQMKVGNV